MYSSQNKTTVDGELILTYEFKQKKKQTDIYINLYIYVNRNK